MSEVMSEVKMFAELKFSFEKWRKDKSDASRNDVRQLIAI